MTILVTGAAGFIGMAVADHLLSQGRAVFGIDALTDQHSVPLKRDRLATLRDRHGGLFTFAQSDIADPDALHSALHDHPIDAIIHLGAEPTRYPAPDHPPISARANLNGHVTMLELARERRVRHFLYASSAAVYGADHSLPFREDQRTDHPVSLHAATHRANELLSESYAHLHRIPMTGLRFFTVYGPWGRPDMAMGIFTQAILAGRPVPIFNHGRMQRDFSYIDDVAQCVVACLDHAPDDDGAVKSGGSRAPHRLYNIGTGQPVELMQLIALLEQACGRRAEIDFRPLPAGQLVASCADIRALTQDIGVVPATLLESGVAHYVRWHRAYHLSG